MTDLKISWTRPMTDLKISWTRPMIAGDDAFAALDRVSLGRLTTDHPASSRGLPVAVDEQGRAYGPAEVGELTVVATYVETDDVAGQDVHRQLSAAEIATLAAGRLAGYQIAHETAEVRS